MRVQNARLRVNCVLRVVCGRRGAERWGWDAAVTTECAAGSARPFRALCHCVPPSFSFSHPMSTHRLSLSSFEKESAFTPPKSGSRHRRARVLPPKSGRVPPKSTTEERSCHRRADGRNSPYDEPKATRWRKSRFPPSSVFTPPKSGSRHRRARVLPPKSGLFRQVCDGGRCATDRDALF